MKRRLKKLRRPGITVILVLGLLAVTIALSYAMLRTQATSAQIQFNLSASLTARQAAQTALAVALRRMHQANWAGVDTPIVGLFQDGLRYVTYQVNYQTGDALLSPSDEDYHKYPYRVTLQATAWVLDAPDYSATSMDTAEAVVELVPRALSSEPSNWASLQNHTVRQWANMPVYCQSPVRIEGPVALQGPLQFCEEYPPACRPWHGSIDEVAVFSKALTQIQIQQAVGAPALGDLTLGPTISSLGPTHWWRLNESPGATTATDSSGGATGSYQYGAVAGVTGVGIGTNRAAHFDGHDDHINVGNIDITGDKLTLLAWFKADSWNGSTDARIISKATSTTPADHVWMLGTTNAGGAKRLRFRLRSSGWTQTLVANSGNLLTGTWYCAAAVYNGTDMILYLNGVEVGRAAKTGAIATNSSAGVYIGDNPPGNPQTRYLRDLEAMRVAGQDDWRPFAGPIDLPRSNNDSTTLSMLESDLNLTVNDVSSSNTTPVAHPGAVTTYQLYAGGKTYSIGTLTAGVRSEDISPDTETNPLGIYRVSGQVDLAQDVQVTGTIITHGSDADIDIVGNNVTLAPVALPALYGSTTAVELPVAIASDDVHVKPYSGIQISGLVYAGDKFTFLAGTQAATCDFQGRLLAGQLKVYGRNEWSSATRSQWETGMAQFIAQLSEPSPEPYFPNWLNNQHGLSSEPGLKISPRSSNVQYHWHDFSQPVFVPHTGDAGLLWKIVRWGQ